MVEPSERQYNEIGYSVVELAYTLFSDCGCQDDFCIQCTGPLPVFGGTNRVVFDPRQGFIADYGYCSEKFLSAFDAWKKAR